MNDVIDGIIIGGKEYSFSCLGGVKYLSMDIFEVENDDFCEMLIDADGKMLYGIGHNGDILLNGSVKAAKGKFNFLEMENNGTIGEVLKEKIRAAKIGGNEASSSLPSILNAAYSSIGLGRINTVLHFLSSIKAGFNALKADVRLTSDGVGVLCHDAYFTLDTNGRIKEPDASDIEHNTNISDMTYEEVMSLEYDSNFTGSYDKVCSLDLFLQICCRYNVIPYLTARSTEDIAAIVESIKKYSLSKIAVINLYPASMSSVAEVRRLDKEIKVSYTCTGCPSESIVDKLSEYGNCVIALFEFPVGDQRKGFATFEENAEFLKYAKNKGVAIHTGQIGDRESYEKCISYGITGFQISKPILEVPLRRIVFKVKYNGTNAQLDNFLSIGYSADVSVGSDRISISNIAKIGSKVGFPEVLPNKWFTWFAYELSIRSSSGGKCWISYINDSLVITADNLEDTFIISITI